PCSDRQGAQQLPSAGNSADPPARAPARSLCTPLSPGRRFRTTQWPCRYEGLFDKFAHRMALAGREHIIVGRILLQDQPHPRDKIARVPPVTQGIEIAEEHLLLQPTLDRCDRARDLAGDEGFAWDWTLVVEQDAVRGMHPVGLAVVDRDPIGIKASPPHKASGDRTASFPFAGPPAPCRIAQRSRPDRSESCFAG